MKKLSHVLMFKKVTNLYNFAEDLDGGEYLFAFRMLMVLFRREFSFADTLYLWEVRINSYDNINCFEELLFSDSFDEIESISNL